MKLVISYVNFPQAPLHAPRLANADSSRLLVDFTGFLPRKSQKSLTEVKAGEFILETPVPVPRQAIQAQGWH